MEEHLANAVHRSVITYWEDCSRTQHGSALVIEIEVQLSADNTSACMRE